MNRMKKTHLAWGMVALFSLFSPAFSAVKQVRVIVDRAGIYIEPSRTSSRIEVVEKGTLLNLFQQKKVKDVWYYVSFTSRQYGSRISGFIHESYVELVDETAAASPLKAEKKKLEEKIQQAPAPEKSAPQTPPEKPRPAPPKAAPKPEVKLKPGPLAQYEEILILTALPKAKSFKFPRREPARREPAWKPLETLRPKEEPKIVVAEKKESPEKAVNTAPVKPAEPPRQAKKEETPPVQPEAKKEVPVEKKAEKPAEKAVKTAPQNKVEKPPQVKKVEPPAVQPETKKETAAEKKTEKPREEEVSQPAGAPPAAAQTAPFKPPRHAPPSRKPGFITCGLGYGSSFGGAGASLQLNTGLGFSLHAGAGLYPTTLIYSETEWVENKTLFSAGLKYYLPLESTSFYPYIDLQYGGLRIEAAQVVIGIWEYSYIYSQEQKALYGPSLLAGTEIRLGRFGINGALGLSYCLTKWEFLEKKAFLAFDAGLIIYF